jgi:AraC-like DNA-binding protein
VVAPVEDDARGIIRPAESLRLWRIDRRAPTPPVNRFVDRYWITRWDLADGVSHSQQILPHPAVNVVLTDGVAFVHGVASGVTIRVLQGRGMGLGILFRPAGFRPFLGRSLSSITDTAVPATDVFGTALAALAATLEARDIDDVVSDVETLLAARVPPGRQPCEDTADLVERVAADPAGVRVEELARMAGVSVRQLQRRFADHVGLNPKAVLRRYRLFEAAERVRREGDVDWAALAAELHYSDQPHLVRDFHATFGMSPQRYAMADAHGAHA